MRRTVLSATPTLQDMLKMARLGGLSMVISLRFDVVLKFGVNRETAVLFNEVRAPTQHPTLHKQSNTNRLFLRYLCSTHVEPGPHQLSNTVLQRILAAADAQHGCSS
jgi:hypothetical protein